MIEHNDKVYGLIELLGKMAELTAIGFDTAGFMNFGFFGDEGSIYILLDKQYNITKRICNYYDNHETQFNINDFNRSNYSLNISVRLYGDNHSPTCDIEEIACYIPEIDIHPDFNDLYGNGVSSRIHFKDFEPGDYTVEVLNNKSCSKMYGGILTISIDEDGDKIGYISNKR